MSVLRLAACQAQGMSVYVHLRYRGRPTHERNAQQRDYPDTLMRSLVLLGRFDLTPGPVEQIRTNWPGSADWLTSTENLGRRDWVLVGRRRRNRPGATFQMLTQSSNLTRVPRLAAHNLNLAMERLASIGAMPSALAEVVELASRSARWVVSVARLNYR